MIYKAGTILLLEEGEYSDFGYCGQLVTLDELNISDAVETFKSSFVPKNEWDTPDPGAFVAWLCTTQRCAALNHETLHIGSYGNLRIPS